MRTTIVTWTALWALALALPAVAGEAGKQEEERKLIGVLQSNAEPLQKDQACRRLAVIGTKEAVPALAALLSDEKLSDVARYGLVPIPDPAVDEALRGALSKVKGRQLQGVAFSLGHRRDQAAIPDLAKLLGDADVQVVGTAARALAAIGGPAAWKALEQALATAPEAARPAVGDAAIVLADALLTQEKRDEAKAIYDTLRASTALPKRIVAAAFRGAALSRQTAGLPLLIEQLKTDDKDMRRMAYRLAREFPGPEATKALAGELSKLPQDRQVLLIQALGDRGDVAALPAILELAKSGEVPVRVLSLRVLGQLADASVVPLLFEAAMGSPADVARAAQASLAGLPDSKEVNDGILAVAEKGDAKVRCVAINTVADRRIAAALPVLLKALDDADEQVRAAALRALGETTTVADVDALISIVAKPKKPQEIPAAEAALRAVFQRTENKPACAEKLLGGLPQAEGASRCAILRLLIVVGGPDALKAVRTACKDANADVQETAIRALCDWTSADAAPDVLELAKTSASQTHAILALRGYCRMIALKDLPADKKLAMCKDAMPLAKRPDEKKLVLAALGETPHPEALKMIEACLAEDAVKAEAELALLRISQAMSGTSPDDAKATLNKLIASTGNANIKKQAQQVLQQLEKAGDFVTAWQVAGPYQQDGKSNQDLFNMVLAPEKPDAKDVKWVMMPPGTDRNGAMIMDLAAACGGGDQKCACVRTWVRSDKEQPAKLEFGTDDGGKVWLNTKVVHANPAGGAATPGKYKVDVTLKQGWNAILMKVTQDSGPWEFCFRICKPDGTKIDGIKLQPTPPPE
ncbi:MAG: HEAT repeat domain-containing protein [Planctomycetota bacterium]|nr:HEAT repeat domain-containing protein [Planctomycetota bacterium]